MAKPLDDLFRLTVVTPAGVPVLLDSLLPKEMDGFGMAHFIRLREHGPQQHGESDFGFRLQGRSLRLTSTIRAESPQDLYDKRDQLLRIFRPGNQPLVLQVHLPGGAERWINCYLENGLSFNTAKRKALVLETEIILNAPDPTFYDPVEKEMCWVWAVPGLLVGENTYQNELPTAYGGSWRSSPEVIITGPLQDFEITNLTSGESIGLLYTISAGEQVSINTAYGDLPVSSSLGTALAGKISPTSDLPYFFMDPDASGGINRFIASGTGGIVGSTQVTMKWHERYIGI